MANESNLKPFKKGQIGNPSGRPKGALNSKTVLKRFLALTEDVKNPVTGKTEKMNQLDIIYLKQLAKARLGDINAMREIVDRFEGKAQQNVDMTSQGEKIEPITIYLPQKNQTLSLNNGD